ncbi:hypothetical protein ACFLTS_00670 [Chloroflexota bacterium]
MRCTRLTAIVVVLMLAVVLASACGSKASTSTTPTPTNPSTVSPYAISNEVIKPKPVVVSTEATTAGTPDDYYAILDITVRNEGAEGYVIVLGSITQGEETTIKEMHLYLASGATNNMRLVFPLEWRGGEWTPSVQTELP